jgi:tRNA(Ile)-lysidine synthase
MPKTVHSEAILPPGATTAWSGDHHRLHRQLRRDPSLLPAGKTLLLAVSGGQDSMALVALLGPLREQHRWRLQLWHGDHRWRPESGNQARALAEWAAARNLPLVVERWERTAAERPSEAAARSWRYERLLAQAQQLRCCRVVTGHTATDRAETLLFNLVRGSHRRGLASLRRQRCLGPGVDLARPLLDFSREDTGRICRALDLPIWCDASNADPAFSRNRLRLEVMPVLNDLHPGADRRLARTAEQLAAEEAASQELWQLALRQLEDPTPTGGESVGLQRTGLCNLQRITQMNLLQSWLERGTGRRWPSPTLEVILDGLNGQRGQGRVDLGDGWQLVWQGPRLWLRRDDAESAA